MAFKSSESCKILNHNRIMSTKIRKKIAQEKLCQYYGQYGEYYEPGMLDHVVKNVHLVWTLKWNQRV